MFEIYCEGLGFDKMVMSVNSNLRACRYVLVPIWLRVAVVRVLHHQKMLTEKARAQRCGDGSLKTPSWLARSGARRECGWTKSDTIYTKEPRS